MTASSTLRRTALVCGAAAALALTGTISASAISSYNATPAPERTETGAFMALWDRDDDGVADRFDWVCSGAMIDDDTFLTAAHCTHNWPAGTRFFTSLEQDVESHLGQAADDGLTPDEAAQWFLDAGYAVEGDTHQDPAYPGNSADSHDIGVIDFAERATTPADLWSFTPATLPTAGQLSELRPQGLRATPFVVAGYGTQEAQRGPGGHTHPGGGVRMKAPVTFDALNKTWVRLAMTAPQGNGGACYGDSGGPNFAEIDDSLVLAGTTITGDAPCYATNVAYRMDTPGARDFLAPFVALP